MLAELGRRADTALTRGGDAAYEIALATGMHLRRIVVAVSVALTRVTKEARDLAWDYQDVAADLRRPSGTGTHARQGDLPQENAGPALRVVNSQE